MDDNNNYLWDMARNGKQFADSALNILRSLFSVSVTLRCFNETVTPWYYEDDNIRLPFLNDSLGKPVHLNAILAQFVRTISERINTLDSIITSWEEAYQEYADNCDEAVGQTMSSCESYFVGQMRLYNAWNSLLAFFENTNVKEIPIKFIDRAYAEVGVKIDRKTGVIGENKDDGRSEYISDRYPERDPYDMSDDAMLCVDEEFWSQYLMWCRDCTAVIPYSYNCRTVFEAAFSLLDYLVVAGLNIGKCKVCGEPFIIRKVRQERFCSDACRDINEKRRAAARVDSPLSKKIHAIQCMLSQRTRGDANDYREFLDYKCTLQSKVRDGRMTEQEALDELMMKNKLMIKEYKERKKRKSGISP